MPPSLQGYLPQERRFSDSASHWTNQNIHSEQNLTWSHSHYLDDLEKELPVDYAFLDEDDEVDYNSVDGWRMRRKREAVAACEACVRTGAHIVYKRRDVSDFHQSDYSELYRVSQNVFLC